MNIEAKLLHVAITYSNKNNANIIFNKIFEYKLEKEFTLNNNLTKSIFKIDEEVIILIYRNENICFEIFISDKIIINNFNHICIEVSNCKEFIYRCINNNIKPIFVKKGSKTLLFIRDFDGNLYEIKEKN